MWIKKRMKAIDGCKGWIHEKIDWCEFLARIIFTRFYNLSTHHVHLHFYTLYNLHAFVPSAKRSLQVFNFYPSFFSPLFLSCEMKNATERLRNANVIQLHRFEKCEQEVKLYTFHSKNTQYSDFTFLAFTAFDSCESGRTFLVPLVVARPKGIFNVSLPAQMFLHFTFLGINTMYTWCALPFISYQL